MNIPNDYDLDLQKIEALLKENNINYLLKEDEIIATSNSIEIRISCDIMKILVDTTIPKNFGYSLFFGVAIVGGIFIILLIKLIFKNIEKPYRDWIPGIGLGVGWVAWFFAEPIYLRIKPKIKIERNKIVQILRNYRE